MDIYFIDLKYKNTLDCSYILETGMGELDFNKSSYAVGDEVSLFLKVPKWQYIAIEENCVDKEVDTRNSPLDDDNYIFIEFVISRKRHTLTFTSKRAHLQPRLTIYLEPVSWGHEDIFKWICMGERPSWITAEEVEEYQNSYPN